MRVMVVVKASEESEAGAMPSSELLEAMGAYNEELVGAGLMLAGEGLHPSSRGFRVSFGPGEPRVLPGPFPATRELIAGFWLWEVKSMEEALAWAKRMPQEPGIPGELELRPVFEAEDFGEALTPELRAREDRLRAETEARLKAR